MKKNNQMNNINTNNTNINETSNTVEKLFEEVEKLNKNIVSLRTAQDVQNTRDPFEAVKFTFLLGSRSSTKKEYARYCYFQKIISDVLRELGIHTSNNGFAYIIDAVKVMIGLQGRDIQLRNDIYPSVAALNDLKKYTIIEHNIRNAIMSACRDYNNDCTSNNMGIFDGRKPANKEFLFYVRDEVISRMIESNLF